VTLELPAGSDELWKTRAFPAVGQTPKTLFEALDWLAAVGGVGIDETPNYSPPSSEPQIRLVRRDAPTAPAVYVGPYRLRITDLDRHRWSEQTARPEQSTIKEEFTVGFDLIAEPGIVVERNGPIRVVRAEDDQNRDLHLVARNEPRDFAGNRSWAASDLTLMRDRLSLTLPEPRSKAIAHLKGVVPILALARGDELFSEALATIEGKLLNAAGVTFRVNRSSITATGGFLDISIRGEPPGDLGAFAAGPRQTKTSVLRLGFVPEDHIRIEDTEGRVFATTSNGIAPLSPDGSVSYRITVLANPTLGAPTRLRYFTVAGVAIELPFDFRDLPIP
jgi:hypothetical protein